MNLNNLRIGSRLGASFSVLLLLLGVVAVLAVLEIRALKADLDQVVQKERIAALAEGWQAGMRLNHAQVLALALSRNEAQMAAFFEPRIRSTAEQNDARQAQLEELVTSAQGKALLAKVVQARGDNRAVRDAVFAALGAGDMEGGLRLAHERLLPVGQVYIVEVTGAARLYRAASVWTAGFGVLLAPTSELQYGDFQGQLLHLGKSCSI